jgi:DNA invertase Pin-like site-specific DNA recombinase
MRTREPGTAAIYARVSTEEQASTSGVPSTGTQVDRCRVMAATLGIPVSPDESNHVVEETHSGADLRWLGTKFMDLVRRAQRGEFTDLICLDIDRFCRAGVSAYFQQEGFFTDAKASSTT